MKPRRSTRPSLSLFLSLSLALLCLLTVLACAGGDPASRGEDAGAAAAATEPAAGAEATDDVADDATPEPEYEPAYPPEVSDEGLSAQDAEQQGATHSHDGSAEHSHGDEDDGHAH